MNAKKSDMLKSNENQIEESYEIRSDNSGSLEDDLPKQLLIKQGPESQELTCRICLNSENTVENPLISPCGCAGSVKHIHLNCLKNWIKSKSNIRSYGLYVSYSWEALKCELCHQVLPEIFLHNGKKIDLIDLPKPQSSYIILETLPSGKQTKKTFYVILAIEKELIKLGREHECDIILNDISATRIHAFIRYTKGSFFLEDNDSKFGTLVLLRNEFEIKPNHKLSIQIGRTVLSFNMMPKAQQNLNENPFFKSLSSLDSIDYQSCLYDEFEKYQSLFQKKRNEFNFNNLIETSNTTQNINEKFSSSYFIPRKHEASSLNSKIFHLTLDKDKDDFTHLQELIQNNIKYNANGQRAKSTEEKTRERKNILDEMKNLNINSDDEDNKENGESENEFFGVESKTFKL